MLRETENLEEQGDILQYLVDTQGLDFNTGENAVSCFVGIIYILLLHHSHLTPKFWLFVC